MNIYVFDPLGILTGPFELSDFPEVPGFGQYLPGNTVQLEKPLSQPEAGHVWVLVEGTPQQLADYRGVVYHTDTGAEQEHFELGDLPEGLTAKPRPGPFYVWDGVGWLIDEIAQLEAALAAERDWRNARIAATDYLAMPDYPLNAEQRSALFAYRQALRDWPEIDHFPDIQGRPHPPDWIPT